MDTPEHELICWEHYQTVASNVPKISICVPLLCHLLFLHKQVARHSDFSTSLATEQWRSLEGVKGSSRGLPCCLWLSHLNDCASIACIISGTPKKSVILLTSVHGYQIWSLTMMVISGVTLTWGEKGILPCKMTQEVTREYSYVCSKLHSVANYETIILTLIH
jgi:hypothetical protein